MVRVICSGCQAGADMAQDYRDAASEDDVRRAQEGIPTLTPGAARRWLRKRLKWALVLHCANTKGASYGSRRGASGCMCQCVIPELKEPS